MEHETTPNEERLDRLEELVDQVELAVRRQQEGASSTNAEMIAEMGDDELELLTNDLADGIQSVMPIDSPRRVRAQAFARGLYHLSAEGRRAFWAQAVQHVEARP